MSVMLEEKEKRELQLALAVLKRAAQNMSGDALYLSVMHGAKDVGMSDQEAMEILKPLFETQGSSVMNKLFGTGRIHDSVTRSIP